MIVSPLMTMSRRPIREGARISAFLRTSKGVDGGEKDVVAILHYFGYRATRARASRIGVNKPERPARGWSQFDDLQSSRRRTYC